MEIRQVTQIKIFKLYLSPIILTREPKPENCLVAISYSYDELIEWYNIQLAEKPYREIDVIDFERHEFENSENKMGNKPPLTYKPPYRFFKKGSHLEWFSCLHYEKSENIPSWEKELFGRITQGITTEWITRDELLKYKTSIHPLTHKESKPNTYFWGYATDYKFCRIPVPHMIGIDLVESNM